MAHLPSKKGYLPSFSPSPLPGPQPRNFEVFIQPGFLLLSFLRIGGPLTFLLEPGGVGIFLDKGNRGTRLATRYVRGHDNGGRPFRGTGSTLRTDVIAWESASHRSLDALFFHFFLYWTWGWNNERVASACVLRSAHISDPSYERVRKIGGGGSLRFSSGCRSHINLTWIPKFWIVDSGRKERGVESAFGKRKSINRSKHF